MRSLSGAFALILVLGSLAAAQTPPPPATREQRQKARAQYVDATRKFNLGKYKDAGDEFETAYEMVGDPVILYNIAQSRRLEPNTERALFFYRSYLRQVPNATNRGEVETRIAELSRLVEGERHAVERPPNSLSHNATSEETRPILAEVRPEEARTMERPGETRPVERPVERPGEVHPGERPPEQLGERPVIARPVEPEQPKRPRTLLYIGGGLAGLAVVGLALGGAGAALAASASSSVETQARNHTPFDPGAESRGKNFDLMGIAGWTLAGAAAVGAGVCLFLALRPQRAATHAMIVVPFASSQSAGVATLVHF